MNLTSFTFLFFCIILIVLYFISPKKIAWVVLLIASIVFYFFSSIWLIIFVFFTTLTTYIVALIIEKINVKNKTFRKFLCFMAMFANFGIWGFLKYSKFLLINYFEVPFVLPLGISFYTFIAMGYLIDIYRNKYQAEKNILKFSLFMSFFPHIIQGPFSRFDKLSKTLFIKKSFSLNRFSEGCQRILWGLFKKLIIADKLNIPVSELFNNYNYYNGINILLAAVLYAIQVYADFSGYMDIVCGISKILGIDLSENFKQPFFSKSIEEFWRRWHITLGAWFRDYMFYPISMSKIAQKLSRFFRRNIGPKSAKYIPSYFSLVFVWSLTGLWHGANWTFLFWGLLNMVFILTSMQFSLIYKKIKTFLHIRENNKIFSVFQILRTFLIICLLRIFSRADSLDVAFSMFKNMFSNIFEKPYLPNFQNIDISIVAIGILIIFIVDLLSYINKWEYIKTSTPIILKNIVYLFLIFSLILFSGDNTSLIGGFIYAKF